ncbi:Predicted component of the ribosome quality control (RQC) complex, YloA/Tae2 family, contains fibronectin-binding (FbpA) and DUF814 domains [Pilibacter termitis]|uniref:Rqc2 homolog RqcH n=1 Tax=Pilibacter termitis TaxID=263852 RepID=A0A1T4NAF1_9ENTE|nr:NFACT RNA binding domain-containing protein [Pilibacter termitis]SJZ75798.1 Predicted component of the ribosome quality control (RQC) complex, YloA/Tae2 family, contains fibronectin-binding (FbpA) and DUF814 domains [Pilibacter termitis]
MSFDGIMTHLVVCELRNLLIGGRINKIHQPYEQELVLVIRSQGKNHKLLLSAHANFARLQITKAEYNNPDTPPNFLQLTRKFLEGAILEDIQQAENDRVVTLHFLKRDELGDLQNIVLILEMMGRHSNIILLNTQSGKIMEAIKHIGFSQNSYRTILPGSTLVNAPKPKGVNPFSASEAQIFELLQTAPTLDRNYLQENFQGLGADSASELAFLLNERPKEKLATWQRFFKQLETPSPTLTTNEKKEFFTPLPFETLRGKRENFTTFSELLDAYFLGKAERDRVKQQGGELLRRVVSELKKNKKKLAKLEQSILDSENAEMYRQYGELLTTYLSQVPRGATSVSLNNYYDEENKSVEILLNPALSPNQNAQKYFQKYQKLKSGVRIIQEQMEQAKSEIDYLESVNMQLENATPLELPVIREELIATKFIRQRSEKRVKNTKPSQPERFVSSDGVSILVGKNNLQNDNLTMKIAKKTDIWLHAKNIPGSHVIIQSDNPSDITITEAGSLAAYFSKYRLSNLVPVDVLPVKAIKKPSGARPGFVTYVGQKTIFSTPDEELVAKLRENANEK